MTLRIVLMSVLCLALTGVAHAQRQKLKVGDSAPVLTVKTWVKGKQTSLEPGKVYIVEFWATWCVPCRKAMPHLTKLQEEFGEEGLVIIGISDEDEDIVEPFVTRQSASMGYTVAVDQRGSTKDAWFEAAGLKGIPASFIVDRKGKIAYIGNPHDDDFDMVITKVIKGRYDSKLEAKAKPWLQEARTARKIKNWKLALKHYDEVVAMDKTVFADVAIEKFELLLVDMNEPDRAYQYATQLIEEDYRSDPQFLHDLARKISTDPKIDNDHRRFDVAVKAANGALDIVRPEDRYEALAAVAAVFFNMGEVGKAVETQKQAWFQATPKVKAEYKRVLDSYESALRRSETNVR